MRHLIPCDNIYLIFIKILVNVSSLVNMLWCKYKEILINIWHNRNEGRFYHLIVMEVCRNNGTPATSKKSIISIFINATCIEL